MTDSVTRTAEQQRALNLITDSIRPHVGQLLSDLAEILVDVPPDDLDREVNNLGHCLALVLDHTSSNNVSEPMRWSLSYAFTILLREHMSFARAACLSDYATMRPITI